MNGPWAFRPGAVRLPAGRVATGAGSAEPPARSPEPSRNPACPLFRGVRRA